MHKQTVYAELENVYDGINMEKKECVGHMQKQVGTALRKLKKENKGIGGKGKLTDALIDKLQNYYGIAIRSNSADLGAMRTSSKRRNLHHHCPDGPDSWCHFKQDKPHQTSILCSWTNVHVSNVIFFSCIYAK